MFVDAAQIAAPQRDAMTVEKFEDLDGEPYAIGKALGIDRHTAAKYTA